MSDTTQKHPAGISQSQFITLSIIGVVLWFVAAMMLKFLAPLGIHEGWLTVLTYVLVVPGIAPFTLVSVRLAKLAKNQFFVGTSIMTMAAMLCDGIALRWVPVLYGSSVGDVAGAGGMILWGAAWGMVWGLWLNKE